MDLLTIYNAQTLNHAVQIQRDCKTAQKITTEEIATWRQLEDILRKNKSQYFNGDDGNIWMIADDLFLYKISGERPNLKNVRIVGILRQNETSKELVFDTEMFENIEPNQVYARKNKLLLA